MTTDLFASDHAQQNLTVPIGPGARFLGGFVLADSAAILDAVADVTARSPFRHLTTPGGQQMSVAMSNCGSLGWVSDRAGYRYQATDPLTGKPWPPMPAMP